MNLATHPGDNFYDYCNGGWLAKGGHMEDAGFMADVQLLAYERLVELNIPLMEAMIQRAERMDQDLEAAQARLLSDFDYLENEIGWTQSPEQMVRAIVEMSKRGYTKNIFSFKLYPLNGKLMLAIAPAPDEEEGEGEDEEEQELMLHTLSRMGYEIDPADLELRREFFPKADHDYSIFNQSKHPEWHESICSISDVTRSDVNSLLAAMADQLGVSPELICCYGEVAQALENFTQEALPAIKSNFVQYIAENISYATESRLFEQYLQDETMEQVQDWSFRDRTFILLSESLLSRLSSKAYVEAYVEAAQTEQTRLYFEDIRQSFDQRLDRTDWISDATRAKAKEKLDAVSLYTFSSDEIGEAPAYELSGTSFLEGLLDIQKSNLERTLSLVGAPTAGNMLNVIFSENAYTAAQFQALYSVEFNGVLISPVVAGYPTVDPSMPAAYNYATFSIIGHELTHGFDSGGANYNAQGIREEWWTPADRAEFQERLQLLVESYGELEVLPGYYNNSEFTLDENVADLGGFQIAYDALMNKLRSQGATEEELRIEARHYFQAVAHLWSTYNSEMVLIAKTQADEHSASKERVNGVARNTDIWYDLYEVDAEHKLYLEPERRAYIW